jgi:hypothetical protein
MRRHTHPSRIGLAAIQHLVEIGVGLALVARGKSLGALGEGIIGAHENDILALGQAISVTACDPTRADKCNAHGSLRVN